MIERELGSGLREVVHQRVRLGILAVLDRQGPCTFTQLRDALGQSDGGLGRHLGVLEQHEYIATEKVFENRKPRTWVRMTDAGAAAFREEQELLAKLLSAASHANGGEDDTAAMTIVFATLLAGEDADARLDLESAGERTDRSALVPIAPILVEGREVRELRSGPITAKYEFPESYHEFGVEQQSQRLMLCSHGLRGGWVTTWQIDGDDGGSDEVVAQALVLELGGPADCAAILGIMGPSTVDVPTVPDARGYLLPPAEGSRHPSAVTWFSSGPYLVAITVVAETDVAVSTLQRLSDDVYGRLAENRF